MYLETVQLSKHFGGIQAVDRCSLGVEQGTITGLIGPNGAGKTTLFNLITGFLDPDAGRVFFDGEDITGLKPHQVFRRNLYRTFQVTKEIKELTVMENLLLMPRDQAGEQLWQSWLNRSRVRRQERSNRDRVMEVLKFLEMEHMKDEPAKNLSGGQKKLLDLARMMMAEPKMVLLDEPTAGVAPGLQQKITDRIKRVCDEKDVTFLVIEHAMNLLMDLCDPIIVMVEGSKLMHGSAEEVRNDQRVIEAYLGS